MCTVTAISLSMGQSRKCSVSGDARLFNVAQPSTTVLIEMNGIATVMSIEGPEAYS